jgi:hypothetical protein
MNFNIFRKSLLLLLLSLQSMMKLGLFLRLLATDPDPAIFFSNSQHSLSSDNFQRNPAARQQECNPGFHPKSLFC